MKTFISAYGGTKKISNSVEKINQDGNIKCPKCKAIDIRYSKEFEHNSNTNAEKYVCLKCNHAFSNATDANSGSAGASGATDIYELPIDLWTQCWYLQGCTSSMSYIAAKLDLDLETVEHMIMELQRIFKVEKPITRLAKYKDWRAQFSTMQKKLAAQIKVKKELHQGYSASQEHDTAEMRRVKNRNKQIIKN